MADGTQVSIVGVATTDATFAEGGGYLADATGGIAVLLTDGTYSRGTALIVTGVVDDRYGQRTLRTDGASVSSLGPASEPAPIGTTTGAVNETVEGRLVEIEGAIASSATTLSAGVAFDVDDGTGPIRVLINAGSGIDAGAWERGGHVRVIGVVGQRDSSGTGDAGYRVQPRDGADVPLLAPPTSPSPSPTASSSATASPSAAPSASPSTSPSPTPDDGTVAPLVSIAESRAAAKGVHLRIRGVVTAESGLIDASSAVVQDASGAILIRTSGAGIKLTRGQLVELDGTTSTKSGMVSLRVNSLPIVLGRAPDPAAVRSATGRLGEAVEAQLIVTRGALSGAPRRSSAGTVSFAIDDGSGEVRVYVSPRSGIDPGSLSSGAWIEVRGVLAQETTGSQPDKGYQVWPRDGADLTLVAPATAAGASLGGARGTASSGGPTRPAAARSSSARGQAGGGPSVQAEGAPRPTPRLGSAMQAGVHAAQALDGSTSLAAVVQPGTRRTPLQALGLVALALAALGAIGLVAWRSGGIARVMALIVPGGTPAPSAGVETSADDEPLSLLTVVRTPAERVGP